MRAKLLIILFAIPALLFSQEYLDSEQFKEKVWDYETNQNFKMKSKVPVVLDFYATWCGPCKKMEPELEALQKEYKGRLNVYKIDVDAEREIARLFAISAMPTIFFIRTDGSGTYVMGYRTADELKQMVDTFLFSTKKSLASY